MYTYPAGCSYATCRHIMCGNSFLHAPQCDETVTIRGPTSQKLYPTMHEILPAQHWTNEQHRDAQNSMWHVLAAHMWPDGLQCLQCIHWVHCCMQWKWLGKMPIDHQANSPGKVPQLASHSTCTHPFPSCAIGSGGPVPSPGVSNELQISCARPYTPFFVTSRRA